MMVPQKKKAEDMSQWLVKLDKLLLRSSPASTADTMLCKHNIGFFLSFLNCK